MRFSCPELPRERGCEAAGDPEGQLSTKPPKAASNSTKPKLKLLNRLPRLFCQSEKWSNLSSPLHPTRQIHWSSAVQTYALSQCPCLLFILRSDVFQCFPINSQWDLNILPSFSSAKIYSNRAETVSKTSTISGNPDNGNHLSWQWQWHFAQEWTLRNRASGY